MKKLMPLAASIVLILVASVFASAGTLALFSDTETSNGNTLTAASLDLNVDDLNINVVKFTVSNVRPGNQPIYTWKLTNVGSITGYLDLENIVVTSFENGRLDPEKEAGDTTAGNPGKGNGELQDILGLDVIVDYDGNGWKGGSDYTVYSGTVGGVASSYDVNELISPGGSVYITFQMNWWNTPNDNQAMTDSFTLDMAFELGQAPTQ